MKTVYWIGTVTALAVLSSAAFSQSLKVRERMASEEAELKEHVADTNKACGTQITAKFDWTGAKDNELLEYSPASYCNNGSLYGIQQACGTPLGKAAVKEKIKSVTCGFGAARELTLKDGAVSYKINFGSTNDDQFAIKTFQEQL
jgi:hypothetical protein